MKKIFLLLIIILISPILSFTVFHSQDLQRIPTIVDSGFDSGYSDYDSGSWDSDYGSSWGSSSWDDDDDDHYYSSGSSSGEPADLLTIVIVLVIYLLIIGFVLLIKGYFEYIRKKAQEERGIYNKIFMEYGLTPGDGSDSEIIQTAYENYVKIQKAWMYRDLEPVRNLLSDEMYNMYQMQLDTLIEDKQINMMLNLEFVCGGVVDEIIYNNTQTVSIILCVNCKDYIIDENNKKVVSGSRKAKLTYVYKLTFVRGLGENKTTVCPACGATVENQMSTTCPYCNNTLLLISSELTLTNKKIELQFKQ